MRRRPHRVLRLADVRVRIEMVLTAPVRVLTTVRSARAGRAGSWLARLAGRAADSAGRDAIAGYDGSRIYLPAALDAARTERRRSVCISCWRSSRRSGWTRHTRDRRSRSTPFEVRQRFLLAERAAVDEWIVRHAPGLVSTLQTARQQSLDRVEGDITPQTCACETPKRRCAHFLAHHPLEGFRDVPAGRDVPALDWSGRAGCRRRIVTRSSAAVFLRCGIGAVLTRRCPRSSTDIGRQDHEAEQQDVARRRVAEMRRRPRIRDADEDEDDRGTGTWVIRTDEPQESVEDPFGLQRPTDRADQADPDALGDSLSELPEARVVRTPGKAKEVLRAGDELPRTPDHTPSTPRRIGIAYPEWDFRAGRYRHPGAIVHEAAPALGDRQWVESALARHGALTRRVRTRFERLRPAPNSHRPSSRWSRARHRCIRQRRREHACRGKD